MKRLVVLACVFAACSCEPEPDPLRLQAVHQLKDARPAARIAAIRMLGKKSDRAELAAIVRASEGAPVSVRVAAAQAMGESSQPEAVDFLGALLLEPEVQGGRGNRFSTAPLVGDDEVSAAAVEALAKKSGPKAKAYLTRSWTSGGPRTRALMAKAGPSVLADALAAEARQRLAEIERMRSDPRAQVQADALEDLARHGTPEALAEVENALRSMEPVEASAAARALAMVGATRSVPALVAQVVAGRSPAIVTACVEALRELGLQESIPALAAALETAEDAAADAILTSLELAEPTDEARASACRAAIRLTDPSLASRAAWLAGAACTLPLPAEDDPPAVLAARFAALSGASRREPKVLSLARASLDHEDAGVAEAAAGWLALAGDKSDGPRLYTVAMVERAAVLDGRMERAERVQLKKDAVQFQRDQMRIARARTGIDLPVYEMPRKLAKLLEERRTASEVGSFSPRPGYDRLLVVAAAGAARLGVDVSLLVETMLSDGDKALRLAAVEIADAIGGEKASSLRERALANDDQAVAAQMAIRNLTAGRPEALDQALAIPLSELEAPMRVELADALARHAEEATPVLLALTRGGDAAVPVAAWALRDVVGEEVTQMFIDRLADPRQLGALDAVIGLAERPGEAVTEALVDAASHPAAPVQVAALQALASRGDCDSSARLQPLADAFDARVRAAAAALLKACAK